MTTLSDGDFDFFMWNQRLFEDKLFFEGSISFFLDKNKYLIRRETSTRMSSSTVSKNTILIYRIYNHDFIDTKNIVE